MKYSSGAIALIAAFALLTSGPALAGGGDLPLLQTDLDFRINPPGSGLTGEFRIVKPSIGADNAVSYLVDSGTVQFNISDRNGESVDNPLFCFDYAPNGGNAQLRLDISSMDGKTALKGLGITSAIQYSLGNSLIEVSPPVSSQCFYYGVGADGGFGLYGRAPTTQESDLPGDHDRFFIDRFETKMKLEVSFPDFPSTLSGGLVTYDLDIRNAGDGNLGAVSFQEVYPGDGALYPVAMSDGAWSCSRLPAGEVIDSGGGVIRFEQVAIAAGEVIRCTIVRNVTGSGTLRLHAGAVSGPGATALFDVAEIEASVE